MKLFPIVEKYRNKKMFKFHYVQMKQITNYEYSNWNKIV